MEIRHSESIPVTKTRQKIPVVRVPVWCQSIYQN